MAVPVMVEEDFIESPTPRTIWLSVTYGDLTGRSQIEITLNKQPLLELELTDPWLPPDNTTDPPQQEQVHALASGNKPRSAPTGEESCRDHGRCW